MTKAPPPSKFQEVLQALNPAKKTRAAQSATKQAKLTGLAKFTKPASALSTVYLPQALIDEAKNAVDALSGPPLRLTYSAFARKAYRREIDRLQKAHHGGKPFPPRSGPLTEGRPLKR